MHSNKSWLTAVVGLNNSLIWFAPPSVFTGGRLSLDSLSVFQESVLDGEQPIAAEGLLVLRQRAQTVASQSRISNILMIVALFGMASARYL